VELVRVDLELAMGRGRPRRLESYRNEFPELFRDSDALRAVAFEEYRLRQQTGEAVGPDEYFRRFEIHDIDFGPGATSAQRNKLPASTPYAVGSGGNSVDQPQTSGQPAPVVGHDFLGFHLQAELGRGAFSRVFLAQQTGLARRRVVLKVADRQFNESHTLAQMQHTNIVPIYSVHDAGSWQAVCMPYFGSTTLADLLRDLRSRKVLPQSGRELSSTLQDRNRSTVPNVPGRELIGVPIDDRGVFPKMIPPLNLWQDYNDVQTVLWIGAKLAEGLAHAHERGILHRDLKPANILVTDEGQPMLLDFNLAHDTKLASAAQNALKGGTLPYMSPEQLQDYVAGSGTSDARADVYSLGVVLYELLTGHLPYDTPAGAISDILPAMIAARILPPRDARSWNPALSAAVASILRHCLMPNPCERYQSARDLEEDLQRQLEHRPLRVASDRSLSERLQKWRRRHPRLTSASTVALLMALLLSVVAGGYELRQQSLEALKAATSFQHLLDQTQTVEALLANSDAELTEIQEGVELCRTAVEPYGVLEHADWKRAGLVARLSAEEQAELNENLGEILLLWARGLAWQAARQADKRPELLRQALVLNRTAGECLGHPDSMPVLHQQIALLRQSGKRAEADADAILAQAKSTSPRSARERFLTVLMEMENGKYRDNLPFLREACRADTKSVSLWMVLGNCYAGLGQPSEAVRCYDVADALAPHSIWPAFHRGLANLELKDYAAARSDFDQVLMEKPELHEARVNRALASIGLKAYQPAADDLTKALDAGLPITRIYFLRAQARALAGDVRGAADDRTEGLRRDPSDELSWIARGVARIDTDPEGAIDDFDAALSLNPRSAQALQNKAHVLSERLSRFDEAIRTLDMAIELNPDSQPAWAGRGVLLARSGDHAAAQRDAEQSLKLNKTALACYQAANVYAISSSKVPEDRGRALELLKQALQSEPKLLQLLPNDPDFAQLRSEATFQDWIALGTALRDERAQ
jgi:serine/threonine protein kinase/Tfp pilus assembly protein PilF